MPGWPAWSRRAIRSAAFVPSTVSSPFSSVGALNRSLFFCNGALPAAFAGAAFPAPARTPPATRPQRRLPKPPAPLGGGRASSCVERGSSLAFLSEWLTSRLLRDTGDGRLFPRSRRRRRRSRTGCAGALTTPPRAPRLALCSRGRTGRRSQHRWSARSTQPGSETTSTGSTGPPGRSPARARTPRTSFRRPTRACSPGRASAPQRGRPRLPPARAAQHLPEPEADREPAAAPEPAPRRARPRRRPARARAAGRARGRRALRRDRRAPGRLPRRPRCRRHHRPLLQGGGAGPADPRGDGHEPPLPRPPAGRAPSRRRLGLTRAAGVDRADEHLLAGRRLIAVGPLARDGQRREVSSATRPPTA